MNRNIYKVFGYNHYKFSIGIWTFYCYNLMWVMLAISRKEKFQQGIKVMEERYQRRCNNRTADSWHKSSCYEYTQHSNFNQLLCYISFVFPKRCVLFHTKFVFKLPLNISFFLHIYSYLIQSWLTVISH